MAKLPTAVHNQVTKCNPWQWSKFHLVITFHCQITAIFVRVVFVNLRKFEIVKIDVKNEQEIAIKFCCWLKKSAAETVKLVHKANTDERWFGDSSISHWHKAFSKGRETVALLPHAGWPWNICTEEMVNTVAATIWEDCHITVRWLAQALDISKSSVHTILHEKLRMGKVAACWVPQWLENGKTSTLRFVLNG